MDPRHFDYPDNIDSRVTPTPSERVAQAREAVLSDNCSECGHAAGWHGENHDDGCDATGHCGCGLNARDCYAKIDKAAQLDALIAAVTQEVEARVREEIAAKVRAVETMVETYSPRSNYQRNPDAVKAEILAAIAEAP